MALATFVASVESQVAAERAPQTARRQDTRFAIAAIGLLTLLAVAIGGYHPYAEDGGLYLAGIKRLLHPGLYPQGTEFVLEPTRLSMFAPFVAGTVRLTHLGLPIVVFLLHIASIAATLSTAWLLAGRCWRPRSARLGAVALLACWLSLPVAGTALSLMDPYLTARSFSTPASVLALLGALDAGNLATTVSRRRRGFILWMCSLMLAFVMHPLMASYALAATLLLTCFGATRRSTRVWGVSAFVAGAPLLAASVQTAASPESSGYARIAMTRTYWFPAEWHWYELLGLAAPLALLAVAGWATSRRRLPNAAENADATARRQLIAMAIALGSTAWLVAEIFARSGSANHLVARVQPLRAFHIVYIVMTLVLGAAAGEYLLKQTAWRWAASVVVLGGIMFATQQDVFPNSGHVEFPGRQPRNQWVRAFEWIRDNTPKDALFALDADYINAPGEDAQCFRAIAERSALPDYSKDGGEASIAPDLASAWSIGQAAQQKLRAPATTDGQRIVSLGPLGVSWVVLDASAKTAFDCPYKNSAAKVCRLP